jgi:hypothetical protein
MQVRDQPTISSRADALEVINGLWREMTANASNDAVAFAWGFLAALRVSGLINPEDEGLYRSRVRTCPGHGRGQSWCAFCGDVCRRCGGPSPCLVCQKFDGDA